MRFTHNVHWLCAEIPLFQIMCTWKTHSFKMKNYHCMRAQKLLYVFARRYQMISACMTVSVRELRTAVREWACCDRYANLYKGCYKGTTLYLWANEWSVHEQWDLAGSRYIHGTEQTLTNDRYANLYKGCYRGTTLYLLAKWVICPWTVRPCRLKVHTGNQTDSNKRQVC